MILEQHYLGCLSHASYLVGDETTGRAVVVDPQRDIGGYLDDAAARGLTIERVIETHFHADFLSGHLELQAATGATISFGDAAAGRAEYPVELLADGQRLSLGDVQLEIWATPGHTPESICVLVYEHAADQVPTAVLTGDTLFVGDVGRPDLLVSIGVPAEQLARQLYASTRRLLTLPDSVAVLPAHGAGSACGKSLSSETSSTIGEQRRTNYALAEMSEDDFVHAVTEGQVLSPLYFSFAANRNRQERAVLDEHRALPAMSVADVLAAQRRGAAILDTREPDVFAAGHLRGSYNVGLGGRFAEYTGDILTADQSVVLVCEPGHDIEARNRLARIGFDRVVGSLAVEGTVAETLAQSPQWVTTATRLSVAEVAARQHRGAVQLVDVRGPGEVAGGKIAQAREVPLPRILDRLADLDPAAPTIVYCAGGYRSMIAASVMRAAGFADVSDMVGGFGAWQQAGQPVAHPVGATA